MRLAEVQPTLFSNIPARLCADRTYPFTAADAAADREAHFDTGMLTTKQKNHIILSSKVPMKISASLNRDNNLPDCGAGTSVQMSDTMGRRLSPPCSDDESDAADCALLQQAIQLVPGRRSTVM
jgi:hypothetical protein